MRFAVVAATLAFSPGALGQETASASDAWWEKEPPADPVKPGATDNRGQFLVSYSGGSGLMLGVYEGQSASMFTIRQMGAIDLLGALDGGMLMGIQARGGAYHFALPTGLATSGMLGASVVIAGRVGPTKNELALVSVGFEWADGTPMGTLGSRIGASRGPGYFGIGVEGQLGGASGVVVFGAQVLLSVGMGARL